MLTGDDGRKTRIDLTGLVKVVTLHQDRWGCPPTLDEIAGTLGISKGAAFNRVKVGCQAGLLKRRRYGPRSIEVV